MKVISETVTAVTKDNRSRKIVINREYARIIGLEDGKKEKVKQELVSEKNGFYIKISKDL
jgi:hypothetical protein